MKKIVEKLPKKLWNQRRETVEKYFAGSQGELEETVAKSLETQCKKTIYGMAVGILFLLLFLLSSWFQSTQVIVERQDAGGDDVSQSMELKNENESSSFQLWIPPKVLTSKEKKKAFENGFEFLEKRMKGKNPSLNEVQENLNLNIEIPENPCSVAWDTSDLGVIDSQGYVYSKKVKKPVIILVTATLTYMEEKKSKIFHVCVVPYSKEKSKLSKVKDEIQKIEKENRTKKTFKIPKKILGVDVVEEAMSKHQLPMLCIFIIVCVGLLWYSEEENQKQKMRKAMESSVEEYPDIISKFVLLLGTGMTIQGVIETIAVEERDSKKYVYQQMVQANHQLKLGMEPTKVLKEFGDNMRLTTYGKFATMMIRSLTRGSKDLLLRLREEEANVFLERKEIARRKGEEASTKLLLPMTLMLLVVLVMLMFPAFMSFSM
ncbi:MAG: type II secretion system protein [Anaerostipes sp.]|nr:type II secretion system protein [Anaerostipes sp.]